MNVDGLPMLLLLALDPECFQFLVAELDPVLGNASMVSVGSRPVGAW